MSEFKHFKYIFLALIIFKRSRWAAKASYPYFLKTQITTVKKVVTVLTGLKQNKNQT